MSKEQKNIGVITYAELIGRVQAKQILLVTVQIDGESSFTQKIAQDRIPAFLSSFGVDERNRDVKSALSNQACYIADDAYGEWRIQGPVA